MDSIDIDAAQSEQDSSEWEGKMIEDRAKIVDIWTNEWAIERSRGTIDPPGAIRHNTPAASQLFLDWQIFIGRRLRAVYGLESSHERPEGAEPRGWARLTDEDLEWFRSWRAGVQKAYATAAEAHAAEHEAARIEHERLHPGFPYLPGAVNSLASAPPDSRVSLEEWGQRRNAAFVRRQLDAAEKQRERAAARARSHPVPGQISAGIGISVAEHLARQEKGRQDRAAARADEAERLRQNRIVQGRPPGTL